MKIKEIDLRYLNEKTGKIGKEISYHSILKADYLLPYNKMCISQQRVISEIRYEMVGISDNVSFHMIETCR